MKRIDEIYHSIVKERNKRLELDEFDSDSKLSVMNGIAWTIAAVIFSFEVVLKAFAIEITNTIRNRINGNGQYYAHALLQYQSGDTLEVSEDGKGFGYKNVDESKRIITRVSFVENSLTNKLDCDILLKIAQGDNGNLDAISEEELIPIRSYLDKIRFAGTHIKVISRKGDVLVPEITVYYDGAILEAELYDLIEDALNVYIMSIEFDKGVYVSKIVDAVKKVPHVTDVYLHSKNGIYLGCYGEDGKIGDIHSVDRVAFPPSGYVRQSSGKGEEKDLPTFRQAIKLKLDN